jgi:hypothetical protein
VLAACPGRVPSLSAYAYQSRVSLLLAYINETDETIESQRDEIELMRKLLVRARDGLDAFGDADLMDEINAALGQGKAL